MRVCSRLGGRAFLAAGVALLALALPVASASAVAPGANGKLFYNGLGDILRVDADGTNQLNLTNTSAGEERPSANGNGSQVVFQAFDTDSWEIWRVNGDGTGRIQLTNDPAGVVNFEPGFSPDGTNVVFMRQLPPDDSISYPGSQDLWRMSASGTGLTNLTNTPFPSDGTHSDECCGEYSPDGSKIVYVNAFNSNPALPETNDIWMMNANGTNQHSLTGPHDYPIQDVGPSWSPDGTKLVFTRSGSSNDGLYLINADGTGLTPVMSGPTHLNGDSPTFSPDGTLIAYTLASRVFTVAVAGGATAPLTPPGESAGYPSWARVPGPPPDTTPPNTVIGSGPPALTRLRTATLTFTSTEPGSSFQCRLDGAATFTACATPKTYTALGDGAHTFRVRAIDSSGNVDATPATRTFTVDGTPPATTITSGPSGKIKSKKASFGFTSSEPGSSFRCSLDGTTPAPCTSPKQYSGLKNGPHTFSVVATDPAGNADPSAATRSFKVKKKRKK